MNQTIAVVSLIVSVVALILAALAFSTSEKRAQSVLEQREQQLIQHLSPRFQAIYSDFDLAVPTQSPRTIEELLDPKFSLVESVSEASSPGAG